MHSPGLRGSWSCHHCPTWCSPTTSWSWGIAVVAASPSLPSMPCAASTLQRAQCRWLTLRCGGRLGNPVHVVFYFIFLCFRCFPVVLLCHFIIYLFIYLCLILFIIFLVFFMCFSTFPFSLFFFISFYHNFVPRSSFYGIFMFSYFLTFHQFWFFSNVFPFNNLVPAYFF